MRLWFYLISLLLVGLFNRSALTNALSTSSSSTTDDASKLIDENAFLISQLKRTVDLEGPTKIITTEFAIKNLQSVAADGFAYFLDAYGKLAYLEYLVSPSPANFDKDSANTSGYTKVNLKNIKSHQSNGQLVGKYLKLMFGGSGGTNGSKSDLNSQDSVFVRVVEHYTNYFEHLPKSLPILSVPIIFCKSLANMFSSYTVVDQLLVFEFLNKQDNDSEFSKLRDFKEIEQAIFDGKQITVTHSQPIKPFEEIEFYVHFSTIAKFLNIVKLHRKIYISEYNNIDFVDELVIANQANNLTGEFNRIYDYSKLEHIVSHLKYQIPSSAHDLAYRDNVGYISNINSFNLGNSKLVKLGTRFPLLGGWNTEFTFSYKVPIQHFLKCQSRRKKSFSLSQLKNLFSKELKRSLELDLLPPIEYFGQISEMDVDIIFPESAEKHRHSLPPYIFSKSTKRSITYSYLDILGRPTISMKFSNLINSKDRIKINLNYSYKSDNLYMKPLYVTFVIFVCFITMSIFSRIISYLNLFKKASFGIKKEYENLVQITDDFLLFLNLANKLVDQRMIKLTKKPNLKELKTCIETTDPKFNELVEGMTEVKLTLMKRVPNSKQPVDNVLSAFQSKQKLVNDKINDLLSKASESQEGASNKNELFKSLDAKFSSAFTTADETLKTAIAQFN